MTVKRVLRYLAPNLATTASLTFGMLSIRASFLGDFVMAAWFILFAVGTDKLDGFLARMLRAATEFGVQMDSFADFLNFGVAPAILWWAYLGQLEALPYDGGLGHAVLLGSCFLWVAAVVFRLARYNVVGDDPSCNKVFFGVPTTLMGGLAACLFLTLLRYAPAEAVVTGMGSFHGPRIFAAAEFPLILWTLWPVFMLAGAYLMICNARIPKLGKTRWKALTYFILAMVFLGYALIFTLLLPELLAFLSGLWVASSLVWSTVAKEARQAPRPPPIFPREDAPPGQMPHRPEDILEPEEPIAG